MNCDWCGKYLGYNTIGGTFCSTRCKLEYNNAQNQSYQPSQVDTAAQAARAQANAEVEVARMGIELKEKESFIRAYKDNTGKSVSLDDVVKNDSTGRWTTRSDLQLEKATECNKRGNDYFSQGQYNEALTEYNEAIRLNPNDAVLYMNRAGCYKNTGQRLAAISDYKQALAMAPNHPGIDTAKNALAELDRPPQNAREVQARMKAGEITPNEGVRLLNALKDEAQNKPKYAGPPLLNAKEIQAKMNSGEITPAEARQMLDALKAALKKK